MSYTAGVIVIGAGILFNLAGCAALLRLECVYERLQASCKSLSLGTSLILLGIFIIEGITPLGLKSLVVMGFILFTSPAAAHALARSSYRYGEKLPDKESRDDYSRFLGSSEKGRGGEKE